MRALILVDLQNDFLPGGALAAPGADKIVPTINALMDRFELVVASKDWHPEKSVHFDIWPVHCVENTHGAEFSPLLDASKINAVFLKGTNNKDDGYSAFEAANENLADYLHGKGVTQVYVGGIATEYCVKQTVLDALVNGFETFAIQDAMEGIYKEEKDVPQAFKEMAAAGARIISSQDIPGTV